MNKLSLPLRLVRTGPDWSSVGPGFFEIATDRRLDCGCSLFQSWEFQSFSVIVRSSPGLFPVPGLDLQTLDASSLFSGYSSLLFLTDVLSKDDPLKERISLIQSKSLELPPSMFPPWQWIRWPCEGHCAQIATKWVEVQAERALKSNCNEKFPCPWHLSRLLSNSKRIDWEIGNASACMDDRIQVQVMLFTATGFEMCPVIVHSEHHDNNPQQSHLQHVEGWCLNPFFLDDLGSTWELQAHILEMQ